MSPPLKAFQDISKNRPPAHGTSYRVMGLMSGTSLDGLDIGVSTFERSEKTMIWEGSLDSFVSIPYPKKWQDRLKTLPTSSAEEWFVASAEWTEWCGAQIRSTGLLAGVDLVVFHGQTVFHRPEEGWTGQLGSGAHLHAALDEIPVVSDLRSLDIAFNGQGAPLVPVAESALYSDFEACLNLGGFANFSCNDSENGERIAWDVGPCNLLLNFLAERRGLPFDEGGEIAHQGEILLPLLNQWLSLSFHAKSPPKSLGREWLERAVLPLLESQKESSIEDLMATAVAYIASVIRLAANGKRTLVTGGGVFNQALVAALKSKDTFLKGCPLEVVIPSQNQIEGKEAHAFAFLGLLRALGESNAIPSITGAMRPSSGGALWGSPRFLRR